MRHYYGQIIMVKEPKHWRGGNKETSSEGPLQNFKEEYNRKYYFSIWGALGGGDGGYFLWIKNVFNFRSYRP